MNAKHNKCKTITVCSIIFLSYLEYLIVIGFITLQFYCNILTIFSTVTSNTNYLLL